MPETRTVIILSVWLQLQAQPSRTSAELGQTSEDNVLSMRNVIGLKIVATLPYLGLRLALLLPFAPLLFLFSVTCTLMFNQSIFL